MMLDIGNGKSVNPQYVASCEIDTRHYMNGSESELIIRMADGSLIRRTHGYGVDIYKIKEDLEKAVGKEAPVAESQKPRS